jgi:hypothetical protein
LYSHDPIQDSAVKLCLETARWREAGINLLQSGGVTSP